MEKLKEEIVDQKEINLKMGMFDVEINSSDNVLNMIIKEPKAGLETLISIQNKETTIRSIIWDNKQGLISNFECHK